MLLSAAAAGDANAAGRLLPLVYAQLRQTALKALASERSGHTLSATALVHEAYLKLVGPREVPWAGRAHFYAAAAEAMRRVLVDHARTRSRDKRGGGRARRLDFASIAELAAAENSDEILALDSALHRLEAQWPEVARVVDLRFYAGLTVEQTALATGVSDRTVERHWAFARIWLHRELGRQKADEE